METGFPLDAIKSIDCWTEAEVRLSTMLLMLMNIISCYIGI
jgi:hypothetical protein